MQFRTSLNSVSHSGYSVDILKSGLQKYLRRHNEEKMVWCMEELYLFGILGRNEKETRVGKAIVSNLVNRIIVMMDEELSFRECEKYLIMRDYLEKFEKSDRKELSYLRVICKILLEGNLCRRNSYGRSWWYHRLELEGDEHDADSDESYFEKFKECFDRGDESWAIWMFKILKGEKTDGVVRFRRRENIYMIWEYLFDLEIVKKNEKLRKVLDLKLKEFFKKDRKERFIFLYASVDLCMYYDGEWNENWQEKYEISLNFYKDMYRVTNYIDVEKRKKLELDEFVYDMHTSEGKKRGKSKEDFKREGCYVLNENEEYLRNDWKNFYVNFVGKSNEKKNGKRGELNKKEIEKREKLEKKEREKREKLEKKEREKREKLEKKEREKREKLEKKEREKREKLEKKEREKREKLEKKEREKLVKKKVVRRKKSKKEDELNFVENKELLVLDESEIKLCSDVVCGNKVVCFEYDGKIYKEGRKSMNYNLDYYVFDRCKEFFGLNCIGMELRLGKFRIVKKDKSVLSYKDNWRVEETKEEVVYAVMEKIGNCEMLIERKNEVVKNASWLKEYCKIGMVRGIFRVSDFNMRNVLIDGNGEFVSIDENDILGKRKDVFGMKNRAVLKELKKNENVLMELLQEIWEVDFDAVEEIVKRFGFDGEKIRENWMKLEEDVRKELNF